MQQYGMGWGWFQLNPLQQTQSLPVMRLHGAWGCGVWWRHRWFQLKWDERAAQLPIVIKEILPIVIAAAMWGHDWQGHVVT